MDIENERIRRKEQKKRLIKQKERRKKILNAFCWAIVFLIICAIFAWQFYTHRDMTEANTHEITVKVDNVIVDWESDYLRGDPYPDVYIISGDTTYYAHPPLRINKFNECSFEEMTQEDQVTLTVKNSNNLHIVGVRSESKVYYDMKKHYNGYYKSQRFGDVIVLCITIFIYLLAFLFWYYPEIYWRIGRHLKKKSKKNRS